MAESEETTAVGAETPRRGSHFAETIANAADVSSTVLSIAMGSGSTIHPVLKVYGVLALIGGVATLAVSIVVLVAAVTRILGGGGLDDIAGLSASALIINVVSFVLSAILAVMYVLLGIRLLRNKRRLAAGIAYSMLALVAGTAICSVMLDGLGSNLVMPFINAMVLLVIATYVDPSLAQERELQRKLRDMEARDQAAEGMLGRDETGQGYISLNFFNLFWIFMVASVIGLILETLFRFVTVGILEDRAGLLFGALSPIYGIGAVLLTIVLNRFWQRSPFLIFVVAAVIGGVFEYFASWFLETAFGIHTWDYSGPWFTPDGSIDPLTFMNINGRTSLLFVIFWGLLGLIWVKLALPNLLRLVNLIPWNWRYGITVVTAAITFLNCGLTLVSLDCWYERAAGHEPTEPVEWFCAEHFDDDFMERRFQTMSVDPDSARRLDLGR